jgi:hypothetical protein
MTKITRNHGLCPYLNTVPRVFKTWRIRALKKGVSWPGESAVQDL